MPNNPNLVPTSINLSLQQLIVVIANISPTIDAPAFVDLVGKFFRILELKFLIKSSKKIPQLATFSWQRMKPPKCYTKGFSSLKRIFRTSQTWKLPIGIFIHWKIF